MSNQLKDPLLPLDQAYKDRLQDPQLIRQSALINLKEISFSVNLPFLPSAMILISSRNEVLVGSREGSVAVINLVSKQCIKEVSLGIGSIWFASSYNNETKLLLGGASADIFEYDYPSLELKKQYTGHLDEINYIIFPKGSNTFYTTSDDCTVRIWNLDSSDNEILFTDTEPIYSGDLSSDQQYFAAGGSNGAIVYSILEKKIISELTRDSKIWTVAFSPKSNYLAAGSQLAHIYIYKYGTWSICNTLSGHEQRVRNLCWASENYIVSASSDHTIKLWRPESEKCISTLSEHKEWVQVVIFDEKTMSLLSISHDKTLKSTKILTKNLEKVAELANSITKIEIHEGFLIVKTKNEIMVYDETFVNLYCKINIADQFILDWEIEERNWITIVFLSYNDSKLYIGKHNCLPESFPIEINELKDVSTSIDLNKNGDNKKRSINGAKYLPNNEVMLICTDYKEIYFLEHSTRSLGTKVLDIQRFEKFIIQKDLLFIISTESIAILSALSFKTITTIEYKIPVSIRLSNDNLIAFIIFENELNVYKVENWDLLNSYKISLTPEIYFPILQDYCILYSNSQIYYYDLNCLEFFRSSEILLSEVSQFYYHPFLNSFIVVSNDKQIWKVLKQDSEDFKLELPLEKIPKLISELFSGKEINFDGLATLTTTPDLFGLLHYLVFLKKNEYISDAIQFGAPLIPDRQGKTAIDYAIELKSLDAAKLIIQSLINNLDKNKYSLYYLSNSLCGINSENLECIVELYSAALVKLNYSNLPLYSSRYQKLPLVSPSINKFIKLNEFEKPENFFIEEETISFGESAFKIKFDKYFLISLIEIKDLEIFRVPLIKYILRNEYQKNLSLIYIYSFSLWLHLLLLIYLMFDFTPYIYIPFIACTLFLFAWEFVQLLGSYEYYFKDFFNAIDLVKIILSIILIVFKFIDIKTSSFEWPLMILAFYKGLIGFRAFDSTRFYIRLITECISNISAFLIIFMYTTLAFGILNITSTNEQRTASFQDIWVNSYGMAIGDINDEFKSNEFSVLYITFWLASLFNVILMLNLIISILGDSFDDFQLMAEIYDCIELIEVLFELEEVKNGFMRREARFEYIRICLSNSESKNRIWKGKILDLRDTIKENIDRAISTETKNSDSLNTAIAGLNSKISCIEATLSELTAKKSEDKSEMLLQVVNEKFSSLEAKLEEAMNDKFSKLEDKLAQLLTKVA